MTQTYLSANWKMIVILIVGVIIAYSSVYFMGKNNAIELEIEKVIEVETGVMINLTP